MSMGSRGKKVNPRREKQTHQRMEAWCGHWKLLDLLTADVSGSATLPDEVRRRILISLEHVETALIDARPKFGGK